MAAGGGAAYAVTQDGYWYPVAITGLAGAITCSLWNEHGNDKASALVKTITTGLDDKYRSLCERFGK